MISELIRYLFGMRFGWIWGDFLERNLFLVILGMLCDWVYHSTFIILYSVFGPSFVLKNMLHILDAVVRVPSVVKHVNTKSLPKCNLEGTSTNINIQTTSESVSSHMLVMDPPEVCWIPGFHGISHRSRRRTR